MRPLAGVRVIDLGIITAGAATSAILADLGAEVIKVESPTYRDPFRLWAGDGLDDGEGTLPPHFRATNRNKLAVSIDLKRAEGQAVLLRLVERSHVVVENFSRGVMAKLGLAFDILCKANPSVVLASVSSQGETGPDAAHVSYGSTLEAVAGLAWGTGYAGGKPEVSGRDVNYPDQVVAIFAAGMIAAALRSTRKGGAGVHLDLSQRDLTAFLSGEAFVAASLGQDAGRRGNAEPTAHFQDCLVAKDGEWVAVTIEDEDLPRLADSLSLDVGAGALVDALSARILEKPAQEAARLLRAAGIKAAAVGDGRAILEDAGASWSFALQRFGGTIVKGFPFQYPSDPMTVTVDAPRVGQHTRDVLSGICGYEVEEIAALAEAGVVEIGD